MPKSNEMVSFDFGMQLNYARLCSQYSLHVFKFLISVNKRCHMSSQSSVCEKIMELLGQNKIDHHQRQVAILSQDSFYRELTPEQKAKALKGQFNFDHPGMNAYLAAGLLLCMLPGQLPGSCLKNL